MADTLILGKVSYYNDPDDYEIELQLSNEDIDHLIKAKNALSDVDNMLISSAEDMDGNKVCEFLFGDNEGFSNKITYQLQGTIKKDSITLPFNSNIFKDILNANKDMSYGTLKLSEAGQAQLDRQKARPQRRTVTLPSTPHPFSGISSIAMNMARSQGLSGGSTHASPFTPNLGGFVPKFRLKAQPSMSTPVMPAMQKQAGILSILPRMNRFGSGETVMQGMM